MTRPCLSSDLGNPTNPRQLYLLRYKAYCQGWSHLRLYPYPVLSTSVDSSGTTEIPLNVQTGRNVKGQSCQVHPVRCVYTVHPQKKPRVYILLRPHFACSVFDTMHPPWSKHCRPLCRHLVKGCTEQPLHCPRFKTL